MNVLLELTFVRGRESMHEVGGVIDTVIIHGLSLLLDDQFSCIACTCHDLMKASPPKSTIYSLQQLSAKV